MLNPPAMAESIENLATETIKKRFPATTETMKKPMTETTKNSFLRRWKPPKKKYGNHIKKEKENVG